MCLAESPDSIIGGRLLEAHLAECLEGYIEAGREVAPRGAAQPHPDARALPFDVRVNQDDGHRFSPPASAPFFP